jgi:hypothetical protein
VAVGSPLYIPRGFVKDLSFLYSRLQSMSISGRIQNAVLREFIEHSPHHWCSFPGDEACLTVISKVIM